MNTVGAHIDQRLAGGLTLSRLVRDRVRDWEDEVFLPTGREPPPELEHGGVVSSTEIRADAIRWLAGRLARASLVAEDWVRRPGDLALERLNDYIVVGGEVYHFTPESPTAPDVDATLRNAQAAHGIAFFGVRGNVRGATLEELAAAVVLVGVDAYDGETYAVAQATTTR